MAPSRLQSRSTKSSTSAPSPSPPRTDVPDRAPAMLFIQLFVNGIQTGALYALIAAGFSLIFGTTRVFHVAHGATFTLAGFVFYELYTVLAWAWPLAALGAALAAAVFGVLVDRYVYAVIQRHEAAFFTVFVASFGLAIVVQNLIAIGL